MFKILALDGGGIRSVFQARILERLEARLGHPLNFDLVAGTSGGSIVACGIQKVSAAQVRSFFVDNGPKIFKKESFLREIDDLWNLTEAKYGNLELKSQLLEVFFDLKLAELPSRTLITSFDLKPTDHYWQPVVFHNFPGMRASLDLKVVDAIMRSTAAPTYFPIYQNHCDGGVWGNNPAMSAVAAALDEYVGNQQLAKIVVLSIGTGRRQAEILGAKRDLGALGWYKNKIIDVLMEGNTDAPHYYVRSLINARYLRVQFDLPRDIKLDDAAEIPAMVAYADQVNLDPILDWMKGFWL